MRLEIGCVSLECFLVAPLVVIDLRLTQENDGILLLVAILDGGRVGLERLGIIDVAIAFSLLEGHLGLLGTLLLLFEFRENAFVHLCRIVIFTNLGFFVGLFDSLLYATRRETRHESDEYAEGDDM